MRTGSSSSSKPGRSQQGIALVTAMLLLLLIMAMSLTMVLSVSSDMLLTGYYGNYRGSFYAADSALNVARQQVINSLNGAIPVPFNANAAPLPNTAQSKAQSAGSSGYGSFTTISSAYSWPEKAMIRSVVVGAPTCTITGGTGTCAAPVSTANNPVLSYNYSFPYSIQAVGQSQGSEIATINDQGTITLVANTGLGTVTQSFAGFGMFIDQYGLCTGGDLVPGTITGPVWTNGSWNFSNSGSYTFTDTVNQVGAQAGFDNGSCKGGTTVPSGFNIAFQKGINFGQKPAPLPTDSFNQKQAVIDGIGSSSTSPTNAALNAALKDASGKAYPAGGATTGVFVPYSVDSKGNKTFTGGGILVEGDAKVTLSPGSNSTAQVYTIVQGGVTTTVTVDSAAGSAGSTTISSSLGSQTINGVPQQFSSSGALMGNATMLYVDGNISGLSGPGQGQPAINNGVALTVTAAKDVTVTGDILYKTEPVYTSGTNLDQLNPSGNTGQVLGIFTANGNVNLANSQTKPNNLEIDASVATISAGGSGGIVNTGSAINTLTIVGGRIQNTIQNINTTTRNVLFDQRFATGGFAPPWFPSTKITPAAGGAQSVVTTVLRNTWLNQTVNQ